MKQEQENLHKLSQERSALRSILKQEPKLPGGVPDTIMKELKNIEERIKPWHIANEGGFTKAKERLKKEQAEIEGRLWIDEAVIALEVPQYPQIKALVDGNQKLKDYEMRRQMDIKANPQARDVYERLLTSARDSRRLIEEDIYKLKSEFPAAVKAAELVGYVVDLHAEGHIVITNSVQKDLDQIAERLMVGKPIFLHGPTGTGKTSLARLAVKRFTGKSARMVYCNPQTREANVWGKTGIRPAGGEAGAHGAVQTVDIYGPLAKAMSEGRPIIFDEFTALPREQQVFIKGIFNAKPGDVVDLVGNGQTRMRPGFQMIFTANLKSEKNPERQELVPEIAREFEQNNLKINYLPRPEAFDVVLARLMQKDGSTTMSWYDINETLPKFLDAMAEIQNAYTGSLGADTARLTGSMDAAGKTPGLKKLVLTQGTVEAILEAWQTASPDKRPSFTEFLDQRLKTTLTFEEYPLADRILAAKILASKGLLRTIIPAELNLPGDVFDFDAAKKLRQDPDVRGLLREVSAKEVRISLSELADLDPFNTKGQKAAAVAAQFLPENSQETSVAIPELESIKQNFGGFLKKSYQESWNGNADTVAKAGEKPEIVFPGAIVWEKIVEVDASKFGEYTVNPDTIGINWENVPKEKIKVFDFSEFVGKPRWKLAKYLTTEWPDRDKYHIPGIEYWKYVFEHPDQAPDSLKDGNYHYFFGSIFRGAGGTLDVPVVRRDGVEFERRGNWLDRQWGALGRVVLLEK